MHSKNTDQIGFFAALFSALAWSTTGIFVRFLNAFSSLEIVAGRCLIGLLFILLLFLVGPKQLSGKIWKSKQAWVLGFLMAGYFLLVVTAYQMAPVAEVAILTNTTPLFALHYSRSRGLSISQKKIWGMSLGMIGVVLVVISGTSQDASFYTFFIGSTVSLFIISVSGGMPHIKDQFDIEALYFILAWGFLPRFYPRLLCLCLLRDILGHSNFSENAHSIFGYYIFK